MTRPFLSLRRVWLARLSSPLVQSNDCRWPEQGAFANHDYFSIYTGLSYKLSLQTILDTPIFGCDCHFTLVYEQIQQRLRFTVCAPCHADDTTPSPQPDSPVKPGSGVEGLVETHQDTAGGKQEEEEEDDPCCSERLLQFMIRNFSQLNDQVLSDPVFIRNLPWYEHVLSKNRPLGTLCQQ